MEVSGGLHSPTTLPSKKEHRYPLRRRRPGPQTCFPIWRMRRPQLFAYCSVTKAFCRQRIAYMRCQLLHRLAEKKGLCSVVIGHVSKNCVGTCVTYRHEFMASDKRVTQQLQLCAKYTALTTRQH